MLFRKECIDVYSNFTKEQQSREFPYPPPPQPLCIADVKDIIFCAGYFVSCTTIVMLSVYCCYVIVALLFGRSCSRLAARTVTPDKARRVTRYVTTSVLLSRTSVTPSNVMCHSRRIRNIPHLLLISFCVSF